MRKLPIFIVSLLLLLALTLSPTETQPQVVQAQGTTHVVYNLFATDGYINMADGTQQYIYGFVGGRAGDRLHYQVAGRRTPPGTIATLTGGAPPPTPGAAMPGDEALLFGNAQFPAPVIYAAVGDVVEIRLKNLGVSNRAAPNDPHSIHLHGLDVNAANDGVPETSLGAVPANAGVPGAGNVVVYMFKADKPGTYMYHCHQEANIHVQMGMYGALVVYNQGDTAAASGPGTGGGNLWGWDYDKDYILLLSEFDVGQHAAEQFAGARGAYNSVNYKPQYWFINGLSFPNTIHAGVGFKWGDPNQADCNNNVLCGWINAHPGYDPFIVGQTGANPGDLGHKVLLRVINMGFQTQPMHMHGFHGKIIGSDQRAWPWANQGPGYWKTGGAWNLNTWGAGGTPFNQGMEKNTLTVGSGETYEWLLDFGVWSGRATGQYDYTSDGQDRADAGLLTQSKIDAGGALVDNTDPGIPIPDPFVPPWTYIGGPDVGPVLQTCEGCDPRQDQNSVPAELLGHAVAPPGKLIEDVYPGQRGQLFPFHNHDDYKATNNGVYPGGMFTMIMPLSPPPP